MKINKSLKILIYFVLCVILFLSPISLAEDEIIEYEYENFKYTIISENEVEILGFVDSSLHSGSLEIPSEIDGM